MCRRVHLVLQVVLGRREVEDRMHLERKEVEEQQRSRVAEVRGS